MKSSNTIIKFLKGFFRITYFLHFPFILIFSLLIGLSLFNVLPNATKAYHTKIIKKGDIYNQAQTICENCKNLKIKSTLHEVSFLTDSFYQAVTLGFFLLFLSLASLKFCQLLYKLFDNTLNNKVFTLDTVKKIKFIGYMIIIIGLSNFLYHSLSLIQSNTLLKKFKFMDGFTTDNYDLLNSAIIDLPSIITGLVILTLAEVFKKGVELQELENETI